MGRVVYISRWDAAWDLLQSLQMGSQPSLQHWQVEAMALTRHDYAQVIRSAVDAGRTEAALMVVSLHLSASTLYEGFILPRLETTPGWNIRRSPYAPCIKLRKSVSPRLPSQTL